MSVETSGRQESGHASAAWVSVRQFFFGKGRPRKVELWREVDLMPPQQMVLGHLEEPRPMGELAHHLHCDSSNITGIVDRLTERGLVERRAADGDRRVKLVALTEAGRELRDELARRRAMPPPELKELPTADLEHLRRIFSTIRE